MPPQSRGRVLDHAEVGLAGEGVERAVAVGEEVEDLRARVFIQQFDGVAQTAGGGVVPVTESGRQDENLFHGRTMSTLLWAVLRPCDERVNFYSHFYSQAGRAGMNVPLG